MPSPSACGRATPQSDQLRARHLLPMRGAGPGSRVHRRTSTHPFTALANAIGNSYLVQIKTLIHQTETLLLSHPCGRLLRSERRVKIMSPTASETPVVAVGHNPTNPTIPTPKSQLSAVQCQVLASLARSLPNHSRCDEIVGAPGARRHPLWRRGSDT